VSTLGNRVRFHRERAERFSRHASGTRNPDTREMYLRLAEREVALAERLERLEDQAREHADLQARADTEVRAAAPKAPGGSPPRYKSRKRRQRFQFARYFPAGFRLLSTSLFSASNFCAMTVKLNEPAHTVASSITMTLLCAIKTCVSTQTGIPRLAEIGGNAAHPRARRL
jgi:hypothetical protein